MRFGSVVIAGLAFAASAQAKDLRDYCPERPGLDTPPCIVDAGHVSVETALADWTLDRQAGSRTDTVAIGDTLIRLGLTGGLEAQLDVAPYTHIRTRDFGGVSNISGFGDMTAALKLNLAHPDGSGFSAAVKPYVLIPTGRSGIGARDWGAGLLVPLTWSLGHGLTLAATPEVDAAVNASGSGRHLAFGSAAGLSASLGKGVSGSVELQAIRDEDPSGHAMMLVTEVSAAWQPGKDWQLDAGVVAGLNHASPDVELVAGVSRRF